MILRPAEAEDLPQLAAFWNGIIRETTITFTTVLKTEESLSAMIKARRAAGREFFVAREGTAIGFASYDQFRSGPGYAHAMEHTILLPPELRGRGAGRALMDRVEAHARAGVRIRSLPASRARTRPASISTPASASTYRHAIPRRGASSTAGSTSC